MNNLKSKSISVPISKNWFDTEELLAIQEPLKSGWVVQGPKVKSFENAFADYTQARHALACTSGTAALHSAALALQVKTGDEVIVPGFTWVATSNVIELIGAKPVFCDISLDTFNLDPTLIGAKVSEKTVGLIPVHLFGLCAPMDAIQSIAREKNYWIIEDAACALGSYYGDKHAGTMGNIGCFSFHPRKSISTGEGGMMITNNETSSRLLSGIRNHGAVPQNGETAGVGTKPLLLDYTVPGLNYRMTDIQGSLGLAQLNRLNFLLSERKRCATYYSEKLKNVEWLKLPFEPINHIHSWQSYITLFSPEKPNLDNVENLSKERTRLMNHLFEVGISTRQGTHAPCHLTYYRNKYNIKIEEFPNSWLADRLTLALPVFPGITDIQLKHVVDSLKTFKPSL